MSLRQNICVFCASRIGRNPRYQSAAQQLGQLIAQGGRTLLYGGSNLGYMGVVSSAALEYGGNVVGIIPTFFSESIILSQPVSELVQVDSFAARKELMLSRSDAFIALPGGVGTLDEITEVLAANQLGRIRKPIGLLNVEGYFDPFIAQMAVLQREGLIRPGLEQTIFVDSDPQRLLARIDEFI